MKKIIINTIFVCFLCTIGITHTAYGQLSLQCPPCLPVNGCDKCWASIEDAQNGGCTTAGRSSDQVNGLELTDKANQLEDPLLAASNFIYPNPSFDGYFTLENSQGFTGVLEIVDSSGKILLTYSLNQEVRYKFRDQLSSGLYILVLKDQNGGRATKKLLVN